MVASLLFDKIVRYLYYRDGDNYLNSCVFDLFVLQKKTVQRCMVFSAFYVRSVEEDDLKENPAK